MSRANEHIILASAARGLCLTALGLSVSCQQAKGDDVATGGAQPPASEAPSEAPPGEELTQSGSEEGLTSGDDIERPGEIAAERPVVPATSDAGVTSGLPEDPSAIAPSFPIVFRSNRSAELTYELYVMHS